MSNIAGTVPANLHIQNWVKSVAAMCQPDSVYWCDGSEEEKEQLLKIAVQCGDLLPLNQKEADKMTTTVTIETHVWPVELKVKDARSDRDFNVSTEIVEPNSKRVVHLTSTRSIKLTELPEPKPAA
jgi:GTP-dependent phosphoenolpyruvate carboxykinase